MLIYNINNKLYDLSIFKEFPNFIGKMPILNEFGNYHTYFDLENYFNKDPYYVALNKEFSNIRNFLNLPFFKIYKKIPDIELYKILFSDMVNSKHLIELNKSISEINKYINNDVKSFLVYNRIFRNFTSNQKIDFVNNSSDFYNFRENFSTFRISNSFTSMKNDDFIKNLYLNKKNVYEIDIKSSDLTWLLFMNFLLFKNEDFFKKIINGGVYELLSSDKISSLSTLYSINRENELTTDQKEIIKILDIGEFISYILGSDSILMPNGVFRTEKYNIAYYGQSLTSIFVMRFILLGVNKYLKKINGKILYTKHDSIIFEVGEEIENFDFDVTINGFSINYCGESIIFNKQQEDIFNKYLKRNFRLNKLL